MRRIDEYDDESDCDEEEHHSEYVCSDEDIVELGDNTPKLDIMALKLRLLNRGR